MSKQKPAFNGISIAYKYRKDLEVRLNTPENPVEEATKQFVDSPLTGVTNLASTISNTIDILDGKEGNRPFLGKQPIRLTDTISEPSSTKTKQQEVFNPDERLVKAIIDESNKPFGFEINQAPYKDKQILPIDNITKGEQSFYASLNDFYTEKNKPLFQKAVERVYQGISEPTKKILRGVQSDDNLLEKSADIGLGVIGSALGTIMTPMNFFSPAGEDIGEQVGKVTTPEFGKKVGEFLPFLTMPNPIAFYGASVGSEFATNEAMKIVNNTNLSDENKQRMLEGIGLGSFVATHRALGKGIKSITKDRLKTEVDRLSKSVDKQVLESMNPKLQGEKQINIRGDKLTQEVVKEKIEQPTQEPIVGDVAEIQKPTIERRTDKAGKEYYFNTETKKRTTKEEFEKLKEKENATQEGKIKQDSQQEYQQTETRGLPTETSDSNSIVEGKKEEVKPIEELNREMDAEVAQKKAEYEQKLQQEKVEKEKKDLSEKDLYGFEEGKDPFKLATAKKILNEKWRRDGKLIPRKEILREYVENGDILNKSKTILGKPDEFGNVIGRKVKKVEADFVEYLIGQKSKSIPTEKVETKVEKQPQYFEYTRPTESSNRMKVPIEGKVTSFEHKGREIITYKEEGGKEWKVTDAKTGFSLSDGQTFKTQKGAIEYAKNRIDKAPKKLLDEIYSKAEKTSSEAEWYKPEQSKPIESIKTETKVEGKIEDIKPQESTIERLKREALDEFKNNQTTNAGFNPLAYKNQIKYGTALLKEGAVKFADWSQRMIKDLGEKIKPQLLRIWSEIKKFGEDLGKIAVDKIGDFVESKYNPARPMKVMEGKILDKDDSLIQKMNEKVSPKSPIAKQTGKTTITPRDEAVRQLRTADYYQKLLGKELVSKKRKEIKSTLEEEVKENPNRIKYNIFKPANLGKDVNPLVKGAYQLLFDKREQFKKDFELFTEQTNKLIREARRSRSKFELIREDKQVFDYMEGKIKRDVLTPQELKLADYLKNWFSQAESIMTNKNARDNYVTHVKRGFLETWKQEGFWEGAKSLFKETDKSWESQVVADIDLMMAKEKFNPFAITRKGGMPYSRDLGKVMQTYGKLFFLKSHFDSVRPQINILNNLLGREGMTNEKNFLKRYAKKMMGENIDNLTPEALRKVSSGLMKFTGLRFLAWNLPAGIVNTAAGIVDNFINLPIGTFGRGTLRFESKQGQSLIRKNNVVDVENLDAAIGLRQQLGKAIDMALFLPMRGGWRLPWGEHYIQGSAYLGMLTEKEFRTGEVSLSRHREILEKIGNIHGAYRDNLAPDAKQTIGTREALQFKLWMFAKVRNRWERYGSGLMKPLLTGKTENIKPENLRSIAKELGLVASAIIVASDDDSPLKEPIQDILSDLYGVFNPRETVSSLRRGVPAIGTLIDLYDLVDSFFTQEKYKTNNKKYGIEKGGLKAEKKLERLIPLYRQYMKQVPENIQETKPKKLL